MGTGEDGLGRPVLHDPAQVENCDAVGEVAHHAEVVRDEHVAHTLAALQVGEEIKDRRLHRDVEGRSRLVADKDTGRAGESAGDGDALLEAA